MSSKEKKMAIEKKVEAEVEIKSSADKFFKRLSSEIHHAPNASSDKVHKIDVHDGDWKTPGSVKLWSYTINGKKESFKEKIEVDEEKKVVSMVAVDGHVLERYEAYKINFETVPKGDAAVVKITITVLKPHVGVEDPHDYLQFAIDVIKDIDTHLVGSKEKKMVLEKKVEAEVEIKSSADKFFKRLSSEIHHAPNASSDKVHKIDVHDGDWKTPGSIKLWSYTINGKKESFKEKIEVDDEKKVVSMVAVDGHVLERYEAYKINFETVPKGDAAVVKITINVLKPHEGVEDPHDYLQFAIDVIKDIDTHLVAQVQV